MKKRDSRFHAKVDEISLSSERSRLPGKPKERRAQLAEARRLVRELAAHPSCRDEAADDDAEGQTIAPAKPVARSAAGPIRYRSGGRIH